MLYTFDDNDQIYIYEIDSANLIKCYKNIN